MGQGFGINSINDFNRVFEQNLKNIDNGFAGANTSDFENILKDKTQEMTFQNNQIYRTGIEINAGLAEFPNLEMRTLHASSEVQNTLNNFAKGFSDSLNGINQKQKEAERAVETLASGGDISVHEVMIASEKASISMQMGLQLRNKILAAYNELYNVKM